MQDIIKKRRQKFIKTKKESGDVDQPFHVAYQLCREANTPGLKFIEKAVRDENVGDSLRRVVENVQDKAVGATKLTTSITELNPTMTVHQVYTTNEFIPDYKRVSFTRLRLMSHKLRVETGRWSRTPPGPASECVSVTAPQYSQSVTYS